MSFMKYITRADCAFLDSMPKAEREAFDQAIIREQERRKGLLSVHELGEALALGKDAVNNLPLKFVRPRRKTSRGMRQVKSVHKYDLIAFLSDLNPSFANFDPVKETLSKDPQTGSQYVQLSARLRRYRHSKALSLVATIMGNV